MQLGVLFFALVRTLRKLFHAEMLACSALLMQALAPGANEKRKTLLIVIRVIDFITLITIRTVFRFTLGSTVPRTHTTQDALRLRLRF